RASSTPIMLSTTSDQTALPTATAARVSPPWRPASTVFTTVMPMAESWPSTTGQARRAVPASSLRKRGLGPGPAVPAEAGGMGGPRRRVRYLRAAAGAPADGGGAAWDRAPAHGTQRLTGARKALYQAPQGFPGRGVVQSRADRRARPRCCATTLNTA